MKTSKTDQPEKKLAGTEKVHTDSGQKKLETTAAPKVPEKKDLNVKGKELPQKTSPATPGSDPIVAPQAKM